MKITLEYPELCLLSSIIMGVNNHPIFSYILFGISLLLGFGRLAFSFQKMQQENAQMETAFGKVRDTILKMAHAGGSEDSSTRH